MADVMSLNEVVSLAGLFVGTVLTVVLKKYLGRRKVHRAKIRAIGKEATA